MNSPIPTPHHALKMLIGAFVAIVVWVFIKAYAAMVWVDALMPALDGRLALLSVVCMVLVLLFAIVSLGLLIAGKTRVSSKVSYWTLWLALFGIVLDVGQVVLVTYF